MRNEETITLIPNSTLHLSLGILAYALYSIVTYPITMQFDFTLPLTAHSMLSRLKATPRSSYIFVSLIILIIPSSPLCICVFATMEKDKMLERTDQDRAYNGMMNKHPNSFQTSAVQTILSKFSQAFASLCRNDARISSFPGIEE